jgi:hypothetical protein
MALALEMHLVRAAGRRRCKSCESNDWGLARGDRKWPLNDGQIPNVRGVRVALGTRPRELISHPKSPIQLRDVVHTWSPRSDHAAPFTAIA